MEESAPVDDGTLSEDDEDDNDTSSDDTGDMAPLRGFTRPGEVFVTEHSSKSLGHIHKRFASCARGRASQATVEFVMRFYCALCGYAPKSRNTLPIRWPGPGSRILVDRVFLLSNPSHPDVIGHVIQWSLWVGSTIYRKDRLEVIQCHLAQDTAMRLHESSWNEDKLSQMFRGRLRMFARQAHVGLLAQELSSLSNQGRDKRPTTLARRLALFSTLCSAPSPMSRKQRGKKGRVKLSSSGLLLQLPQQRHGNRRRRRRHDIAFPPRRGAPLQQRVLDLFLHRIHLLREAASSLRRTYFENRAAASGTVSRRRETVSRRIGGRSLR